MANVLLEASACGRSVITSNIHGCSEIFIEGISGFGFDPRNVDALYEQIVRFINLPQSKKIEMGKAAREKVVKEFDRQIVVDAYMNEIVKFT